MMESSGHQTSQTQLTQPPIGTINEELYRSWLKLHSQQQNKELTEMNQSPKVSYPKNDELKGLVQKLKLRIDNPQSAHSGVQQLRATLENDQKIKLGDEIKRRETEWKRVWQTKEKDLRGQITDLQRRNKELEAKVISLEIGKLQRFEIKELQAVNSRLRGTITTQEENINKLIKDNSQSTTQQSGKIKQLQEKLNGLEDQLRHKKNTEIIHQPVGGQIDEETFLKSAICLTAMESIKRLETQIQSEQFKQSLSNFTNHLKKIDKKDSQALANLYERNDLKNKFEAVLTDVAEAFRNIQTSFAAEKEAITSQLVQSQLTVANLEKEKAELSKNKRDFESTNAGLSRDYKTLESNLKAKVEELNKALAELKARNEEIVRWRQSERKWLQEKKKIEKNGADRESALQTKMTTLQSDHQRQILRLGQEKEQTRKDNKATVDGLQDKLTELTSAALKLKKEVDVLTREKAELTKSIQDMKKKIQQENMANDRLTQSVLQAETTNEKLASDLRSGTNQNKELKIKLEALEKDMNTAKSDLNSAKNDLSRAKNDLSRVSVELQDAQANLAEEKSYSQAFKVINRDLLPQLSYYLSRDKIRFDIDNPERSLGHLLSYFKDQFNQVKFFAQSDIVSRDKIEFLLGEITTFEGKPVKATKMFHRHDPRNQNNFHHYIDGKDNYAVLIKLSNNVVIGGYSSQGLEKGRLGNRGFLFSLTLNRSFPVRKNTKSSVQPYDDYFYIFGNSEMRIKPTEMKLFSNFGVQNSTFDNCGATRAEFLGVDKSTDNDIDATTFEFYQIILD